MSGVFNHILAFLSQYIPVSSSLYPTAIRSTNNLPKTSIVDPGMNTTPDHGPDASKPKPVNVVSQRRWGRDVNLGACVGRAQENKKMSFKGSIVAPEISRTPIPATHVLTVATEAPAPAQEVDTRDDNPKQEQGDTSETYIGSSFNISLISDTSSTSEDDETSLCLDELSENILSPVRQGRFESPHGAHDHLEPLYENDDDPFGSFSHIATSPRTQSPLLTKCGLGISGIPDGLGLVGVKKSGRMWSRPLRDVSAWNRSIECIEEVEEDESEEGGTETGDISQTFLTEALNTWIDGQVLASIPEGEYEGDIEEKDKNINSNCQVVADSGLSSHALSQGPTKTEKTTKSSYPRSPNINQRRTRVTLTRDLSTATISSGLKKSLSYSESPHLGSQGSSSPKPKTSPRLSLSPSTRPSPRSSTPIPTTPLRNSNHPLVPSDPNLKKTKNASTGQTVIDLARSSSETQNMRGVGAGRSLYAGNVSTERVWRI